MNILGIIDGQHDSGACILKDGELIAATAEERIERIKMLGGFPYKAIKDVLEISNMKMEDIDAVAVGSLLTPPLYARLFRGMQKAERDVLEERKTGLISFLSHFVKYRLKLTVINPESVLGMIQLPFVKPVFRMSLPKGLKGKPLHFVNHHLSHASAAYFSSGKKEALVISSDCWGDGLSLAIFEARDGNLKRLYTVEAMDSLGHFYSAITKYLGFKPFRHEGKITGLSAHGDAKSVKTPFPFVWSSGAVRYVRKKGLDIDNELKSRLDDCRKEDVAAWLQDNMMNWIREITAKWVKKTGMENVLLVGGLFSNVRFNQVIHEIPGVKFIYVFPEMGDGGLSVGGACHVYSQQNNKYAKRSKRLENVYLGRGYTNNEIEAELKKQKIIYKRSKDIEKEIAELISKGKVVARFNGRMEYGPRALGNRSILYHAKDPDVNNWLNKRLKRTEFMPFAPATLYEHRGKCYKNMKGAEFAAKFMTITFDCTDFMKKNSPAAVHVDGTARPQLVTKEDNPSFYRVIEEYHKITGIPTVINTSFNIHEEPIVRSPADAIRAFQDGHLDYLAIGDFLVENR
ncbi:MAG TPA: carbamoyltransferase C-terminal domain-containing protein [Candidatus Nanoarchaeia archaeon]|nr:carbamoyltransferase C-terminal domain-containing protein [Candidatus Nanoarchaeia archaeon]